MKIVGRTAALLLMLLIVPLFTAATCNFALYQTVRNADTYRNAFNDPMLFEDIIPLALPAVLNAARLHKEELALDLGDLPFNTRDVMRTLSPEAWGEATAQIITPIWLQQQVGTFVELLLRVIDGDFTMLDDPIDMSELKARLEGEPALVAARLIVEAAPPCNAEQLARLNDSTALPVCLPPTPAQQEQSVSNIAQSLQALSTSLPSELTVGDFFGIDQQEARFIYLLALLDGHMMSLTYLCPISLLALMVFFTVRSVKSFGRWIGSSALFTSVIVILAIVFIQVVALGIIAESARAQGEIEQFVAEIVSTMLRSLFSSITTLMLVQAGIFGAVGFILVALSFLLPGAADDRSGTFLITEDGQIISTASLPSDSRTVQLPTPPPTKR
jgi:hypothetical protein